MKKRALALFVALFALTAVALSAADLTIDYQVNTGAQDYANNYLTVQGKAFTANKDQFDTKTGASKLESTLMFNVYRFDALGGKLLPGGLRGLLLYPVADDGTRTGDGLTVTKNSDGSILVRYCHRGTANELLTDRNGRFVLPGATVRARKIGHSNNVISTDFSRTGKVADIDWNKVWDTSIASDKAIPGTPAKTGPVAPDAANSTVYVWTGPLQFTLDGRTFKINGALDITRK